MNPAIRVVRILQFAFIFIWLMLAYSMSLIHPGEQSIGIFGQCIIVLVAIEVVRVGFKSQRMMIRVRSESLSRNTESTPVSRWMAGNVVRFATALSASWGGLLVHFLRGSDILVYFLFAGSMFLLVLWQPGEVPTTTESRNPVS